TADPRPGSSGQRPCKSRARVGPSLRAYGLSVDFGHVSVGGMQLRILGPLEAWHDGRELSIGSGRQRALLLLLLLHAHEHVSGERLIDLFWDEHPPATAAKVIQGYVSQLRRALPEGSIETRGSGYVLRRPETDA